MERILFINLLTVIAVGLDFFWKLSDPRSTKNRLKDWLKPKSILIGVFVIIYYPLNYLSATYFPLPDSGFDQIISVAGLLIFTLGVVLSVWAKLTMGKVWGIPAEHHKDRQSKLITTGPFHYSRNPIYVGLVMVLVGYGLALQSYFTFLAIIPIFYFSKFADEEEKLLEQNFKNEYLEYKKRVPKFF